MIIECFRGGGTEGGAQFYFIFAVLRTLCSYPCSKMSLFCLQTCTRVKVPPLKRRLIRPFWSSTPSGSAGTYLRWAEDGFGEHGMVRPNSPSFLALTEFQGENSVSSSQRIICVPKRTHRVFRRTHRVSCRTQ